MQPIAVIGNTSDEDLILQGQLAADRFEALFDTEVPATVIVATNNVSASQRSELKANGYRVVMPWISQSQRMELRESAVRSQVEAQSEGLPEAVRDMALKAALDQIKNSGSQNRDAAILAHELAHKWFIEEFTPANKTITGHSYGGWAPDWLDEAVAISMESEELQTMRRNRFANMNKDKLFPLAEFLTMEHPSAKAARDLAKLRGGTGGNGNAAIILSGDEARDFIEASGGDRAPDFYAQALVFTDYLQARSDDPRILTRITNALAKDEAPETWLAGNDFGLPTNLSALEQNWADYVASRSD